MSASITRPELLKIHTDLTAKAREIMTAKNKDYANELDVFRNFRRYGTLGVLVRLSDKLARLDSFEENKSFAVADEKLVDTIIELVNYAVIYYAMKQEGSPETPKVVAINSVIQSGPYCSYCHTNLADFGRGKGIRVWICSNCAAERAIDTTEWDLMGRL